ncbi:MAG: methylated-DNA--[protein]-cysteine S-methyltransferase [Haliea sp.]|nr:methylated-DNA--[protein]-cysteine S-methyltransferase [Haliea sp.]
MNMQYLDSPIGTLRLLSNGSQLVRIEFENHYGDDTAHDTGDDTCVECSDPALAACAQQLREYFTRRRRQFDLPLAAAGTTFQRSVWQALAAIPYGELRSYRDIAQVIGNPSAVRAVGAANGRNPLPIVVPCHRVIGSNGSLTGFAGGLDIKTYLLELEGALSASLLPSGK